MVIGCVAWLWCLLFSDPAFEARHPAMGVLCAWGGVAFCMVFAVLHYIYSFVAIFQGLIALLVVAMVSTLTLKWRRARDPTLSRPYAMYLGALLIAFPLWVADQHFCEHLYSLPGGLPNPQFHAWRVTWNRTRLRASAGSEHDAAHQLVGLCGGLLGVCIAPTLPGMSSSFAIPRDAVSFATATQIEQ